MKRKMIAALLGTAMVLSIVGCHKPETLYQIDPNSAYAQGGSEPIENPGDYVPESLTEGLEENKVEGLAPSVEEANQLSQAAFNLMSEVDPNGDGNLCISPYSIDSAVGMAELGADGDTLSQMEECVNGGVSSQRMNEIMKYLWTETIESSCDWNVSNSLWIKDDGEVTFNNNYLMDVKGYYSAPVYARPFDETTIDEVNSWVNVSTNNMIPKMIDEIPEDARAFLINAIAFESEWEEQYEENDILENREFHNQDGTTTNTTMLYSKENSYFNYGDGIAFARPYKGGEYYFVGILPNEADPSLEDAEGDSIARYLMSITQDEEGFAEAFLNREYSDEVFVQMPEFEMDYDAALKETYQEMGMDIPFDQNLADFNKMFDTTTPRYFWIGEIIHKTHIEVNREGTKAAAATLVEMRDVAAVAMPVEDPIHITLDRPFLYAVVDSETGTPMFAGYVNNLK